MKVWLTTKGGDKGSTSLYDGRRVEKDSSLVDLYGTVDEAQAALGLARALSVTVAVKTHVEHIERRLYEVMAVMAQGNATMPPVEELEGIEEEARQIVGDQFEFRLPGASAAEAAFHLARTITRRAERRALDPIREGWLKNDCLVYLNRLSDCIYALALWEAHAAGLATNRAAQH